MKTEGISALVTGGASGLGLATAKRLLAGGAAVTLLDLETSDGASVAAQLGDAATFTPADVTDAEQVRAALAAASAQDPLRAVVHCAGRGGTQRLLSKDGSAADGDLFAEVVRVNLIGTHTVVRLAAECMAATEPVDGERGVLVLTSSIAAFEGRIGQVPYAVSKAGIVGMTLAAARDLASKLIRVVSIAPGVFDTALLGNLSDDVRAGLASLVPHPARLGAPDEFGALAVHIVTNPMLNGETIRLDGALRMTPR